MSSHRTGYHHVRGLRLAHHVWGDPKSPAILLLHGFQDHGLSYSATARALEDRYFLVAADLRGHGESDWVGAGGDYHFYDYFYDVMRLVDRLGLEKFGLVGHSMGGNVSSGVASLLADKISRLILLEGMGFQTHDLADTVNRLHRWSATLQRKDIDLDPIARKQARTPMRDLAEAAERLRRYNERLSVEKSLELASTFTEPVESGIAWRFDPLHKVPAAKPYLLEEISAMWRALPMPVLSLYGSESPWIPADIDRRLDSVKTLRSGLVTGSGHNIHHDRPEVLARAIDLWMRDPTGPLPDGIKEGRPIPG